MTAGTVVVVAAAGAGAAVAPNVGAAPNEAALNAPPNALVVVALELLLDPNANEGVVELELLLVVLAPNENAAAGAAAGVGAAPKVNPPAAGAAAASVLVAAAAWPCISIPSTCQIGRAHV